MGFQSHKISNSSNSFEYFALAIFVQFDQHILPLHLSENNTLTLNLVLLVSAAPCEYNVHVITPKHGHVITS